MTIWNSIELISESFGHQQKEKRRFLCVNCNRSAVAIANRRQIEQRKLLMLSFFSHRSLPVSGVC